MPDDWDGNRPACIALSPVDNRSNIYRTISLFVLAGVFATLLVIAPDVVLVIFAGILFSVFFSGGGGWISRHTGVPRGWGIGLFIVAIVLVLAGAIGFFAPAMSRQVDQLAAEIPAAFENLSARIAQYSWGERILKAVQPAGLIAGISGQQAASAVTGTFGALGNFVIMLFIGIYGAIDPFTYRKGLRALLAPSLRPRADVVLDRAGAKLQSWLSAQFMSMAAVGLLTWLGLWLIGIPLAFILGLIAAILAFIPNIGPLLAAAPAILLAFTDDNSTVLMVIAVYAVVQGLESYILTPLIQQEKVSLPPALIISVQLLMGVLFGILGLALATPLAALGMTLVCAIYIDDFLEHERK